MLSAVPPKTAIFIITLPDNLMFSSKNYNNSFEFVSFFQVKIFAENYKKIYSNFLVKVMQITENDVDHLSRGVRTRCDGVTSTF